MRYGLTACTALAVAVATAAAAPAAPTTVEPEIEMEDFSFRPARLTVRPGALVVWKNRDRAPHNAVALARRNGRPLFRTRTGGFRAELTARAPQRVGSYAYLCTVHPNMRGVLRVRR
jgi:plastocyanin